MSRFVLGSALLLILGCGDDAAPNQVEIAVAELACASADPATASWESTRFPQDRACSTVDSCCAWTRFEGQATIRMEHALGRRPRVVVGYISFDEHGVGSTLASGDALRILSADDTHVVVENNTEQRFFLRLDLR